MRYQPKKRYRKEKENEMAPGNIISGNDAGPSRFADAASFTKISPDAGNNGLTFSSSELRMLSLGRRDIFGVILSVIVVAGLFVGLLFYNNSTGGLDKIGTDATKGSGLLK